MDKSLLLVLSKYDYEQGYLDNFIFKMINCGLFTDGFLDGEYLAHVLFDKKENPYLLINEAYLKDVEKILDESGIKPLALLKVNPRAEKLDDFLSKISHDLILKREDSYQFNQLSNIILNLN